MKTKKLISVILVLSLLALIVFKPQTYVEAQTYTAHSIASGSTYTENPLKGFVPYNYGTVNFPHTMEWFYIAVNEVQTGMNEFNWAALEQKLNDVASRGHQAVMRFYYDYPSLETGVPQFLIDGGLEMKYYNEPVDLGGDGYAPNYEDPNFRQAMKNFIAAFGKEYDGDGRLAYVTIGLLGFWGEWHNWPYDEDTSDGKADWSISTTVYKEVLDSFDAAFNVTPLCVREPKSGISYTNYDIGFHDDSFGYATLSTNSGGQSWSFMQKMFNFNLGDKWKTNCIGGEVYPPSQYDIFSGKTPDGSFQSWDLCMNEAHATWMLNNAIRDYSGTNYDNAIKAAAGMGYDFQVSTAYFSDTQTTNDMYLKVDIKNIGCAPFYYDHNVWPVEIGVKQGNNVVKTWRTQWDLCNIPADGSNVSFEHTINNHGLAEGTYSLGIKVINPISNGKNLYFANASQNSDGWLELGTINVSSNSGETTNPGTSVSTGVTAKETSDSLIFNISSNSAFSTYQLYIDADGSSNTGYFDLGDTSVGYDYLVENEYVFYHANNDGVWENSWSSVSANVAVTDTTNGKQITISKSSLPLYKQGAKVKVKFLDDQWATIDMVGPVVIEKTEEETTTTPAPIITDDLEIYGYQISTAIGGIRTVYSHNETIEGQRVEEVGLIYGIQRDGYSPDDMVANSNNSSVYMQAGTTTNGLFDEPMSMYRSYAMTMKFASFTAQEFNQKYYVRAYAKLSDGTYAYTPITSYTIYYISDYLYQNELMKNLAAHEYLYNNILKVVDNSYKEKEFGWSIVVKPYN